jgi:hypothetical protein
MKNVECSCLVVQPRLACMRWAEYGCRERSLHLPRSHAPPDLDGECGLIGQSKYLCNVVLLCALPAASPLLRKDHTKAA